MKKGLSRLIDTSKLYKDWDSRLCCNTKKIQASKCCLQENSVQTFASWPSPLPPILIYLPCCSFASTSPPSMLLRIYLFRQGHDDLSPSGHLKLPDLSVQLWKQCLCNLYHIRNLGINFKRDVQDDIFLVLKKAEPQTSSTRVSCAEATTQSTPREYYPQQPGLCSRGCISTKKGWCRSLTDWGQRGSFRSLRCFTSFWNECSSEKRWMLKL